MLAALLATRAVPVPPVIIYGNQFVAATTTFLCASLAKSAAALSTNPVFSYQLLFSTQGHESIVDSLDRLYYNLVNPQSSNSLASVGDLGLSRDVVSLPTVASYLSINIAAVIVVAVQLNTIIQSLPVAQVNVSKLEDIQRRMRIALNLLHSLAIPITIQYIR